MMRLVGSDGTLFEMSIVGYQFPELRTGDDANWLVIRGNVVHPRGEWTWEDPCLETKDVRHLAGCLEPNLQLCLTDQDSGKGSLEVYFQLLNDL